MFIIRLAILKLMPQNAVELNNLNKQFLKFGSIFSKTAIASSCKTGYDIIPLGNYTLLKPVR